MSVLRQLIRGSRHGSRLLRVKRGYDGSYVSRFQGVWSRKFSAKRRLGRSKQKYYSAYSAPEGAFLSFSRPQASPAFFFERKTAPLDVPAEIKPWILPDRKPSRFPVPEHPLEPLVRPYRKREWKWTKHGWVDTRSGEVPKGLSFVDPKVVEECLKRKARREAMFANGYFGKLNYKKYDRGEYYDVKC